MDSKGKQYFSPDNGYAISIPPGAFPDNVVVTLKHGVVPNGPFGPFKFPDEVRPISAILFLHPTTEQLLHKPVEIALPHVIHCERTLESKQIAVFKANCTDFKTEKDGKQIYCFEECPSENLTLIMHQGFPYAKFSLRHYCYLCLVERYRREDTENAVFCLLEAIPRNAVQHSQILIHFCVLYFLPTCLKVGCFK